MVLRSGDTSPAPVNQLFLSIRLKSYTQNLSPLGDKSSKVVTHYLSHSLGSMGRSVSHRESAAVTVMTVVTRVGVTQTRSELEL